MSHSDLNGKTAGFSLLEAMISFAVAAMILTLVISGLVRTAGLPVRVTSKYFQSEMARSLLEEFAVTFPEIKQAGTYREQWEWRTSVRKISPLEPTKFDTLIEFFELSVEIRDIGQSENKKEYSMVIARPGAE